jgi:hypothetical protein
MGSVISTGIYVGDYCQLYLKDWVFSGDEEKLTELKYGVIFDDDEFLDGYLESILRTIELDYYFPKLIELNKYINNVWWFIY